MAASSSSSSFVFSFSFFFFLLSIVFASDEFSIVDFEIYGHDYSPPSPPLPPPPPPHPPPVSCVDDLKGIGSLNGTCQLNTSLLLVGGLYVQGEGSLVILPGVTVTCAEAAGCEVTVNMTGEFVLGENSSVVAGLLGVEAGNVTLRGGSVINTTGLAGEPPPQTSGTPSGTEGAGGGHGGRGASCVRHKGQRPEDVWGGDAYSWSSLMLPWSYGSKGGTTVEGEDHGGGGGGRVWLTARDLGGIEVSGTVLADGGNAGLKGGGGSGGSIYIKAHTM